MLRSRIIPCLLIRDKGLVKTVKFKEGKYVGDPLNAVKIFNEKEVDELMVMDIDATAQGREPDFQLIKNLASECRMPLCYGGGVKSVDHARKIISLGAEKVAISAAICQDPGLIKEMAKAVGCQSVVAVIDVKKRGLFGKYEAMINNGKKATGKSPVTLAEEFERMGAGEIVINNVDQDGVMKGYDLDLAKKIREKTSLPLTILGGAGSMEDINQLISEFGVIGAAAGSIFVFKGKYKAVLINYPAIAERRKIIMPQS